MHGHAFAHCFHAPLRPAERGRGWPRSRHSPPLALRAGPAKASTYRGIVGDIKPRATDSSLVDMIKLLPEGIGVIPVYLNLTQGSREEYGRRKRGRVRAGSRFTLD